jgi:hypothetical protein
MKEGKVFAIVGVALAVGVGLFLLLKPKTARAEERKDVFPPTPEPANDDACPDKPTFLKCRDWESTKNCYNPLLINPATGLYPNGTNPCGAPADYEYGYDYELPNYMQNPGPDDTIFG